MAHGLNSVCMQSLPRQKRGVGDAHAIYVATRHKQNAVALEIALWQEVENMDIRFDEPSAACIEANRKIMSYTFLREEDHIYGSLDQGELASEIDCDKRRVAEEFLRVLNGDWRLQRLVHHCLAPGVCDCKQVVFAALVSCNVVINKTTTRTPSAKDWGTSTLHIAGQTLGMLCHGVGPRCFADGLPSWSDIELGADPDELQPAPGASPNEQRLYLRRKSCRAKCTMQNKNVHIEWCAITFSLAPVEHLLMRVQKLDGQGDGLLDCLDPTLSPVEDCQRALATNVSLPADNGLGALLHAYAHEEAELHKALASVVSITFSAVAQLWVRFLHLSSQPMQALRQVNPRETPEQQDAHVRTYFDTPVCCKRTELGVRMDSLFESPEAMMDDAVWRRLLRLFLKKFKLCNMHVERIIARIRKSHKHILGKPHAMRVVAGGYLSEVLTQHFNSGGLDPRQVDRVGLSAMGVPVRRRAKRKRKSRPASGFVAYAMQQESVRRSKGISLKACGGRKRRWSALRQSWLRQTAGAKAAYAAEAEASWHRRRPQRDADAQLESESLPTSGTQFKPPWAFGSKQTPFAVHDMRDELMATLGSFPGAYKYLGHFLQVLSDASFVEDSADIGEEARKIKPRMPCWRMHPGLCCQESHIYDQVVRAATACYKSVEQFAYIKLTIHAFDDVETSFACCAWKRKSPKVAVWILHDEVLSDDGQQFLRPKLRAGQFLVVSTHGLLKDFFLGGCTRSFIQQAHVRHVVQGDSVAAAVIRIEDEVLIYPVDQAGGRCAKKQDGPGGVSDALAARMRAGLAGLQGTPQRQQRQRSSCSSVKKAVAMQAVDHDDDDGESQDHSH